MDGGEDGSGFTCNICFECADKDPIVTPCGHLYCKTCIHTWLRSPAHTPNRCPCPVCNAVIKENILIPLYGIGKSHPKSRSVPVPGSETPDTPVGLKSVSSLASERPNDVRPVTPSAPEWPTYLRPTPSAPEWPSDQHFSPSALERPTAQTLATASSANVILNQICRVLIRVGQYLLVRLIEVATDKLIEVVETKINELNEAEEERNNEHGEGAGHGNGSSEEVEVTNNNGEGSSLGPSVVLNPST